MGKGVSKTLTLDLLKFVDVDPVSILLTLHHPPPPVILTPSLKND